MDAKADQPAAGAADKLLDNPGLSIERLPMLALIFDRLATACAEGLRPYSPAILTCFVNSIATDHVWDALDAYDGSIAAILYSPELDARVLVGLDRRCIFSLMEVLLGGDGQEQPFDGDRIFSTLEVRVAQTVFEIAAEALHSAFGPVVATKFQLERVETRMDFTVMGRRNVLAVVAKILIQAMDMGGQMFVVIPQPALTPIRQQLSRDLSSDGSASDPRWRKMMQQGVQKTEVKAVAILDEQIADARRHLRLARRRHAPAQGLRRHQSSARLQEPAPVLVRTGPGQRTLHVEDGRPRRCRGHAAGAIPRTRRRRRKRLTFQPNRGPDVCSRRPYPGRAGPSRRRSTRRSMAIQTRHDAILRIPVTVQVVLGSARMPVAHLMKLGRGAVVALDQRVGEPVNVVVNGRIVARGEVVVVDEDNSRFGVSLTEIVGSADADAFV